MARLQLILTLFLILQTSVNSFKCSVTGVTCNGLVGYNPPNATTISAVKSLFAVKNLRSILGANNLPLTTPSNFTLQPKQTVKVPFPCSCHNGTGKPVVLPTYTVVPGDGLFHIAAEVFSGLVTYQQIQAFNGIKDVNLIKVGEKLKIPLPCSCDEVDDEIAVHYGHVVVPKSTVEGIAQEFGTSADTLLKLNGLASSKDLQAGVTIDVPLKACTSEVGNSSLDYPLLVSNGTYAFTAANCVMCTCDAANNWTLQCQSSQVKSALWETCPPMLCGSVQLQGTSTPSSDCNKSSCIYAGYTNETILAVPDPNSSCPDSQNNSASVLSLRGWRTSFVLICIHALLFHLIK